MKIAIISDTHDNFPNFKKAIDWIEKNDIKTIIHCGDICTLSFLKDSIEDFSGKIYLCLGNVDIDHFQVREKEKLFNKAVFFNEKGEIKKEKKKIAFTHFPKIAKELALTGNYDIVFHGHTHKPWIEKVNNVKVVNPGNLAGLMYKATFAVYNTKNNSLELKILEKI